MNASVSTGKRCTCGRLGLRRTEEVDEQLELLFTVEFCSFCGRRRDVYVETLSEALERFDAAMAAYDQPLTSPGGIQ